MRLGLAYNQRPDVVTSKSDGALAHPDDAATPDVYVEWDEPETIAAVAEALGPFGDVVLLEAVGDFPSRLAGAGVDLLFNMAEGLTGASREAQVPAIAEFLGVPYTGSDPVTLGIALHKARTKELLAHRKIPTAPFVLVESEADLPLLRSPSLYPVFLKPVWEGSSKGVNEDSFATSPKVAERRALAMLHRYRQPVLAESYLPGEEFTVAILGNGPEARCFPLIRYRFDELPGQPLPIMGYEAKWVWDTPDAALEVLECPAAVPQGLAQRLEATGLAAFRALACRDWARIDLRLDAGRTPNVVEVNPLPGIIPNPADNSCFPRAAAAVGMSYDELIQSVVRTAWSRIAGRELPQLTLAELDS